MLRAASAAALLAGAALLPAGGAAAPTWHTGLPIAPDRVGLGAPAAALGAGGDAIGAWTLSADDGRAVRVEVRARHGRLAPWRRELLSGPVPAGAGGLAAAMAPGGSAAVAWRAAGGRVHVAVRVGRRGAWRVAAVPSGPAAAGPAAFASPRVAAGADGSAAVVWAAREAPGWVVRGAARSGARGVWRATPALALDPGAGMPSLGLAPDGGAAVAWSPQPGPGAVRAALRPAGGGWGPAVVLDGTGGAPSAAAGAGGTVRVAWSTGGGDPVVRVASADLRAGSFGAAEDVAPGSAAQVGAPAGGGLAVAWMPTAGGLAALVRGPAAPGAPAGLAAPGAPADGRPTVVAAGGTGRAAVTWIEDPGPGAATAGMATGAPGAPWRTALQPVGEDVPAPAAAVGPGGDVLVLTAAVGRSGTGRTVLAAAFDDAPRPRLTGAVAGRRIGPRRVAWTVDVRNASGVRAAGVRLRVLLCCGALPVAPLPAGAVRRGRALALGLGTLPPGGRRAVTVHARLGPGGRAAPPLAEVHAVAVPPVRLPVVRAPADP